MTYTGAPGQDRTTSPNPMLPLALPVWPDVLWCAWLVGYGTFVLVGAWGHDLFVVVHSAFVLVVAGGGALWGRWRVGRPHEQGEPTGARVPPVAGEMWGGRWLHPVRRLHPQLVVGPKRGVCLQFGVQAPTYVWTRDPGPLLAALAAAGFAVSDVERLPSRPAS